MEIVASFVAAVAALVVYCKLAPCFGKVCPTQSLLARRPSEAGSSRSCARMPISMRWTASGRVLKVCDVICEIQKATCPPTLDDRMAELMVHETAHACTPSPSNNTLGTGYARVDREQLQASEAPTQGGGECDSKGTAAWAYCQCQRLVIKSYCQYVTWGLFRVSYTASALPVRMSGDQSVYHPIQDPVGALSIAMMIVRKNRPGAESVVSKNGCNRICVDTRRLLAAVVCTAQKMCSQTSLNFRYGDFIGYVFQEMLDSDELPTTRSEWDALTDAHIRLECGVLGEPLLQMAVESPIAVAEAELWAMHEEKLISATAVDLGRGSLFLFIAACWTNPHGDVMGELQEQIGIDSIGRACALLSLCLMDACGKWYHYEEESQVAAGRGKLKASVTDCCATRSLQIPSTRAKGGEWDAIRTMLQNASLPHATMLRIGPYRERGCHGRLAEALQPAHPVQELVARENINRALRACPEAMAGRELTAELA
jgi:hypothetical protein